MYFVTVRQEGYALFSMTPGELGAVGLVDDQKTLRLLRRSAIGDAWSTIVEWPVSEFSHTDFMLAMQFRAEPSDPLELTQVLPESVRARLQAR